MVVVGGLLLGSLGSESNLGLFGDGGVVEPLAVSGVGLGWRHVLYGEYTVPVGFVSACLKINGLKLFCIFVH